MKCEDCKYSKETVAGSKIFECRFNPPNFKETFSTLGEWPRVTYNDWCGQFKHKDSVELNNICAGPVAGELLSESSK